MDDNNNDPLKYLTDLSTAHPELTDWCITLADLYQKKLWHELTITLKGFIPEPIMQTGDALIQLYHNFIIHFETKINHLKLALFAVAVSRKYPETETAITFLIGVIERLNATNEIRIAEPILYIKMQIAVFELLKGDQKECRKYLDNGRRTLDSMTDIDPSVYACYHWVKSQYHRDRNEYHGLCKNALLYLAYTPLESLTDSFKKDFAFELCLYALVASNVYNFGELLAHPVVKSLIGSEVEWVYEFLEVVNSGNLVRFEELFHVHKASQPGFVDGEQILREKINILCLMEIILSRQSEGRTFPLSLIAEKTQLSIENVEHLLMKSLSVPLIKGKIDQVNGTIYVKWVRPRVLGISQITTLKHRLDNWIDKLQEPIMAMESQLPDLV